MKIFVNGETVEMISELTVPVEIMRMAEIDSKENTLAKIDDRCFFKYEDNYEGIILREGDKFITIYNGPCYVA